MNEILIKLVASELNITIMQVKAVLELLQEGNTIPFIARYRKEVTNNLDEDQINEINKYYEYQKSLLKRKEDVIRLIDEKKMLTKELETQILNCQKLVEVEDIYRPYKEKKKTRATDAIAKGLQGLADYMLNFPISDYLEKNASKYLSDDVLTTKQAIDGAKDIIAEMISDTAKYRQYIKRQVDLNGVLKTQAKKKHDDTDRVYEIYYDYSQMIKGIPSHRYLAINRAEKEKVIQVSIDIDPTNIFSYIFKDFVKEPKTCLKPIFEEIIEDAYKRLIKPSIDREIRQELNQRSETKAIEVFARNLEQTLMQPKLKDKMILGVDPAFRTGCKLAVIDKTGKCMEIDVIYPTKPKEDIVGATKKVLMLLRKYPIDVIAIGNGTASRETQAFIAQLIQENKLDVAYCIVSEAGASVYSASKIAQEEFPDFSVEQRSAVSIARRLLDPLSELVKIDPKAIGVGQYQHDLNQTALANELDFVVSKVVNQIGVDLNTASVSLLSRIAGLNQSLATNIIAYRDEHGKFSQRKELLAVKRLGQKAFDQAAGFLRIMDGTNPLEMTPIHPESYHKALEILKLSNLSTAEIGNQEAIQAKINPDYIKQQVEIDEYTLNDIIAAFKAPMADMRDQYDAPKLMTDVLSIEDLKEGMVVEGVVRNITDFGAFIDIGLKNDALCHISELSTKRAKHPLDVVSVAQIVKAKVLKIDLEKKKVNLTLK